VETKPILDKNKTCDLCFDKGTIDVGKYNLCPMCKAYYKHNTEDAEMKLNYKEHILKHYNIER